MASQPSYTEITLAQFMVNALGQAGADLDATFATISEAVNETLDRYGVSDVATATDIPKLRALARAAAWEWATDQYVTRYGVTLDGQSLQRQQLYTQAKERAAYWTARTAGHGVVGFNVRSRPIVRPQNPYGPRQCPPLTYP